MGQEIAVYGKYDLRKQSLSAYKLLANKNSDDGMAPIYSINRQIKQKKLQTMIDLAIAESMDEMGNAVPEDLRKHYRLMADQDLVIAMHHPKDLAEAKEARRSAVFREFFLFQMQLALMSSQNKSHSGYAKHYDLEEIGKLTKSLPFALSPDQKKVINEIFADMFVDQQDAAPSSGGTLGRKTVAAVFAIYRGSEKPGYQSRLDGAN